MGRSRPPSRAAWLEELRDARRSWLAHVAPSRTSDRVPIHPARVVHGIRRVLPDDGVLLSDVGVHHNWIVQEWEARSPLSLLQGWGFASMGFGVAGVIGAHLAAPERPAVAVVGDGRFLMLPSVVATAVQYEIPAVWVVWNNGGFISIRDQQRLYFDEGRELATSFRTDRTGEPHRTDFVAMARSMGADSIRVEQPADLAAAFEQAIVARRPMVIDVQVEDRIPMPGAGTWELPPLGHPTPSCGWPDEGYAS